MFTATLHTPENWAKSPSNDLLQSWVQITTLPCTHQVTLFLWDTISSAEIKGYYLGSFIHSTNIYQKPDMCQLLRKALGIEQQTKETNSLPSSKEVNRYYNLLLWGLGTVFAKHWHPVITQWGRLLWLSRFYYSHLLEETQTGRLSGWLKATQFRSLFPGQFLQLWLQNSF